MMALKSFVGMSQASWLTGLRSPAGMQRARLQAWRALCVLGILALAVLIGMSTVFLPWFLYVGAAALVVYPVLVFKAPWIAFTLYVVAVFIAPGLKSADALTLAALALFALRWVQSGRPQMLPGFMAKPYMALLFALAVALTVGVVKGYSIPMVYGDARGFLYWLWLPILYPLIQSTPDGLGKLARAFAFIAGAIAMVALLQYFTGMQLVASGRVAGLDAANAGQTRVQMHGFLFISVAAVWALVALVHSPRRFLLFFPFLLLMLAALYANFGRALWFWTMVAVALSVYLSGQRRGLVLALTLLVGGTFAIGGLLLAKPQVLENIVERMESVRVEGGARTSYGWRRLENDDALPHIFRNPLTGIGLGGEYRRWMHEVAAFEQHTRYVHNSYVFVALKAGVPCLLAMLALLLSAWWRGWRAIGQLDLPQRSLRIAALASLFPLMGVSITQPELVTPMSVLLLVAMAALMGSCEQSAKVSSAAGTVPRLVT